MDYDYKNDYIIEINDYLEQLDLIFSQDDFGNKLKDALRIVKLIVGIAKINEFDDISRLSKGVSEFIEDLINNNFDILPVQRKLLKLSIQYYLIIIGNIEAGIDDQKVNLSFSSLFEGFKLCFINENISVDQIYQKDVLDKNSSLHIKKNSEHIFNKKRKVDVSLNRIDNIINKLNDIVLNQHQLKVEIEKIRGSEIQLNSLLFMQNEYKDIDENLKKVLINHITSLKEVSSNLYSKITQSERDTFTLQEEILNFRMLSIGLITNDIKNEIEKYIGTISDKKIKLHFDEKTPSIDKFILQKLKKPMLNIIHNAIEHGIDPVAERKKKNKEVEGNIFINYSDTGSKLSISIKDDGCGIDYDRIRKKCLELFPFEADDIKKISDNELIKYLFFQNITTYDNEENKGFGLYEALLNIEQVKGKITLQSEKEDGVEVVITVPKSLTTVNGFFITASKEKFLIPSTFIKEIVYVDMGEVIDLLTKYAIKLRNEIIPIYPLSGIIKPSDSKLNEKLHIIIVEEFGEQIGIIVDDVLYHSSVIYKPLPGNIEQIKLLQGVAFDEDHRIVNILYIPEIIKKLKKIRNIEFRKRFTNDDFSYKSILLIDDSPTNREIEANIIKQINKSLSVDEASDGIEALDKIRDKYYNLIITDSDMPKMDGLTFIENLRKEVRYKETPVIAIVSSENEKMMDNMKKLGVKSIFNKSKFDRDLLVSSINNLLSEENEK